MAQLINGKELSARLKAKLKSEIESKVDPDHPPHLVVILAGDDPASLVYIKNKERSCQQVGIKFTLIHLPEKISEELLLDHLKNIRDDKSIHGCIIQLPLPKHLNQELIIDKIPPNKDVDCFHPINLGKLLLNQAKFLPATPNGILRLIQDYQIPTEGKHIVIIGKSLIVGQPLMNLLALEFEGQARGTVTCCDRFTENLTNYTSKADILIVSAGKHHLINSPEQIKEGSTVIDVGIHRIPDSGKKSGFRLEGDVDRMALGDKVKYITPVPGGVGPMTVYTLLENVWKAYLIH